MSRQELLAAAKRGNSEAITSLLNERLVPKGIRASTALKGDCLVILLEASAVPPESTFVPLMRQWMTSLSSPAIASVRVLGRKQGELFDDWESTFTFNSEETALVGNPPNTPTNVIDPPLPPVEAVPTHPKGAIEVSEAEQPLATETQPQSNSFWGGLMGHVGNAAGAVGGAVGGAATGAAGLVAGAAGAVGGAAAGAGGAIVGAGGALGNAALNLTDQAGYVIDLFGNSPELQKFFGPVASKIPNIGKFLEPIFNIDIVKAESNVKNIQSKYPAESKGDLANRLMVSKAIIAGGSGVVTSLPLPGFAAALFPVDVMNNAMLQSELVYSIAYLYGFNLKDPARKAEVAAILGLSIGGSQAAGKLTARLGIKAVGRNIPLAGGVISASTNAAAIYAMGYAACRFYEAKLANQNLTLETALEETEDANEEYLASIVDDQVAMDWVLVRMFLAGHPDKKLADLIPQLEHLNLNPASTEALQSGLQRLPSLDELLPILNDDFGVVLLAKCQTVAEFDGIISPEEEAILNRLKNRFESKLKELDLDSIL